MAKRIFQGWYIAVSGFLCLFLVSGIGLLSFPVFVKPLETEFGWSRTLMMGAIGLAAVATGFFSPILGYFVDLLGARRIMLSGIFTVGLCFLLLADMQSVLTWYVVLFVAALGMASATYIPVASLITRWFVSRRGLAMSIAMAGMGAGGFVMPNISNLLIQSFGWRWAYRVFGLGIWIILLPPVWAWVYGRPSDIGMTAYGEDRNGETAREKPDEEPGNRIVPAEAGGLAALGAIGTFSFWAIGFADLANAFAVVGIGVHLVAFSIESGVGKAVAAFAYSLISAFAFGGILLVGLAADRFNHRAMISLSYGLPALGILLLFDLRETAFLFIFAAFAGMAGAGRAALWPLVINDTFGRRAYATVMGFLILFYAVGVAVAPPLTGYIYDITKSYYGIFIITLLAFILSSVLIGIGARPKPRPISRADG